MTATLFPAGYRHYILGVLLAACTLNFIDRYVLAVLLPDIKREFGLADWQLGILTGPTFAIFYSVAGLPIARWADGGQRVRIIGLAIAVWSLMSAAGGIAASYWQLLCARIGVAIGEAGCTPPSHSLIGDLYPPRRRATALAIYQLGPVFGVSLALLVGGWLADSVGWRRTLIFVGLPGLLLALLVFATLREPPRGMAEGRQAAAHPPPMSQALRLLWECRTYRHLVLAIALVSIASNGVSLWLPSFVHRVHGLGLTETGRLLSVLVLAGSTLGGLCGGAWAQRAAQRDPRGWVLTPGWLLLIGVPVSASAFLAPSLGPAIAGIFVLKFTLFVFVAPTNVAAQLLVGLRMRAFVSAFTLLMVSVIGLGVGPPLVGLGSDLLGARFGDDGLRYSLLASLLFALWGAAHYLLAARTIAADIARVSD
ncbi:MAG: spinster family MFS transporter [Gammaproteobacteria bacterium]